MGLQSQNDGDHEFKVKLTHVKIGYAIAIGLCVIALTLFVGAIATGVGAVAGIGGIFIAGSFVTALATWTYHLTSGLLDEQAKRQFNR